jgi:predicted ribosomally synthesized peptide with nif11-like leader
MSMESVVAFWKKVDKDSALQRQLDPKGGGIPALQSAESYDRVAAVAHGAGFDVTPEELRAAEVVKQFWMRVDEDDVLQGEIVAADSMPHDAAVALIHAAAKKRGFDVTPEQLVVVSRAQTQAAGARAKASEGELDEAQLASVVGGSLSLQYYYYYYYYRAPTAIGSSTFLGPAATPGGFG